MDLQEITETLNHVLAVSDPVANAMGERGPNFPRPGTPPSRVKRGRKLEPNLANLAESLDALTPPVDRRQRRRTISTSPEVASGSITSPFPDIASSHAGYESFLVYLPNATSVDVRVDGAILKNLSVHTFVELVQTFNERQNPAAGAKHREVQWTNDVYIEDFEGNAVDNGEFCILLVENRAGQGLLLYDNHPETVHSHPGFWNVTPVPHVLDTLPQDYTVFSALADELDNSLQAVYQLKPGKRRLICVDLDHKNGKIVIYDTGKGMDSTAENSISKWGTLGASMNRHERSEAIGGNPPYLKPNFGMYGFGGIGAGFHLGGSISVSSKTEASQRVSILHLTKNILKTTTADGRVWKTAGEFRSPIPKELELSPHGSFTKVEISNLKGDIPKWKVADVQRKLKDYYFPYIQNDEGTGGTTSTPVQIRVNDVDLAEVLGGEVAHSNYYSGNGEPYVLILKFKKNTVTPDDVAPEGNARITCRYFPTKQGKEAILEILDKLSDENPDHMEVNFEKFSRRSIRRLGRLLPDSQNEKLLPFMEPKRTLSQKTLTKRCYKRVKAFIDVDAGFTPNQTKMDLLSGDLFSTALLNLGKGEQSRGPGKLTSSEPGPVTLSIQRLGQSSYSIEERDLQKDYENWITSQHQECDTGPLLGESDGLIISTEKHKAELNISGEVFQVVYSIKYACRAGDSGCIDWSVGKGKSPIRLKLQKGIPNLNNNDMVLHVTVECFVSEGFPESPGEARIICRPIWVPEDRGSRETKVDGDLGFELGESRVFPIEDIIFSDKCEKVDEDAWLRLVEKMKERLPGFIEVLNDQETKKLVGHDSIPKFSTRAAGAALPAEILAVVRPNLCRPGNLTVEAATRLEPKFIIGEAMEVTLVVREIKYHPQAVKFPRRAMEEAQKIYETTMSTSKDRKLPKGVYSFSTTALERITKKSGTYFFIFSLVSAKHQDVDDFFVHMNVAPSPKIGTWSICSHPGDCNEHHKNQSPEAIRLRLGRVKPRNLYLSRVDEFGNPMEFEDIPSDIACSICTVEGNQVAISPVISRDLLKITNSRLNLEIPITVDEGNLAPLRPTMRAVLKMTIASALVASFTLSVYPGEVSSARIKDASEAPGNHLYPGQIIDEMVIEVLDECQNPVSSGQKVKVLLDGFAFQDKNGPERSVDENGRLDLGVRLRVKSGFGESARVEIRSTENLSLLVMEFTTINRSLRVINVPDFIPVGSQLVGLAIEAIDENEEVDVTMSGRDHILTLDWDRSINVPLFQGRCTLQGITMPLQEGEWEGCVSHTHYPNLQTKIKVNVVKKVKSERVEDEDVAFTAPVVGPSQDLPTSPVADIPVADLLSAPVDINVTEIAPQHDYLKFICQSTLEETVKLEKKILRLDRKLTKQKGDLERLHQRQKQHEEAKRQYNAKLDSLKKVALHPVSEENRAVEAYYQNVGDKGIVGCTADQVELQIANLSVPPGTNAATLVLQAQREKHSEVLEDIIGIVALLGAVETEELNRALVEFLGLENMLSLVCRSRSAAEYIGMPSIDRAMEDNKDLCDFVKSRNLEISGRFRVITLNDESSFFKRVDGQQAVDTTHPQRLLNMGPSSGRPKGSLGYAANMILLNEEQLQIKVSGHHGLRESLFFLLFGFLEVFDTTENMLRAREHIRSSAVSLEGGLSRTRNQFELGSREDPAVWFPTWIPYMAPEPLQSVTPSKSVRVSDNTKKLKLKEVEAKWQATNKHYLSEGVEENVTKVAESINRTEEKIFAAQEQLKDYTDRFESLPGREHIHGLSLAGAAETASRARVSPQTRKVSFQPPSKS